MIRKIDTNLLKKDFEFKEYRVHIDNNNNNQLIVFLLILLSVSFYIEGGLKAKFVVISLLLIFLFYRIYLKITYKSYLVVNAENIYFNDVKIAWKEVNDIHIEIKSSDLDESYVYYFYTTNKIKLHLKSNLELSPEAIETVFVNYFYSIKNKML